jgi:hypothetical protein
VAIVDRQLATPSSDNAMSTFYFSLAYVRCSILQYQPRPAASRSRELIADDLEACAARVKEYRIEAV